MLGLLLLNKHYLLSFLQLSAFGCLKILSVHEACEHRGQLVVGTHYLVTTMELV